MAKPMARPASNAILYGNIDPDTGLPHGQAQEEAVDQEEEEAPLVRMTDFKHTELEGGDWKVCHTSTFIKLSTYPSPEPPPNS